MPVISRFLGIIILMYWRDHNPPHIHAKYNEYEISISLTGEILSGFLPSRSLKLVKEWIKINRKSLEQNWSKAQIGEKLEYIKPLE
ncbi:MAG: DUF4160 domain-containing protein [Candidatus Caenarcaniphilales bacterium]|nr:DUF4160 domain-containing protein [Candidatus Caenarcaniphilales bacterium]